MNIQTETSQGILVFADISGYTRFSRLHYTSLLHAEQIISELMDAIIQTAVYPLQVGQLEGDAVLLHVPTQSGNEAIVARDVLSQIEKFFAAFNARERSLIACDAGCVCEACSEIGELRLKAVIHFGEYKHGSFRGVSEISGADIILMRALLKTPLPEREHILLTENFFSLAGGFDNAMRHEVRQVVQHDKEITVHYYLPQINIETISVPARSASAFSLRLNQHSLARMIRNKPRAIFNNLPKDEMNFIVYIWEGIASGLNVFLKSLKRWLSPRGLVARSAMMMLVEIKSEGESHQAADVEMLKQVLNIARPALILNKLEDRAAFLYAFAGNDKELLAENLLKQAERMYAIFKAEAQDSPQLSFRVFCHYGEVVVKQVGSFDELAGLPVILLHRIMQGLQNLGSQIICTSEFAKFISGQEFESLKLTLNELGEINIQAFGLWR